MSESQAAGRSDREIPRLFAELAEQAKLSVSDSTFLTEVVVRVSAGLNAVAVVVWLRANDTLRMAKAANFERTGLADHPRAIEQHRQILDTVSRNGLPCLVGPEPAHEGSEEGNPTQYQLLIAPLRVGEEMIGLIETFQDPDAPPLEQQGRLSLLIGFAKQAGQHLLTRRYRLLQKRSDVSDRLLAFHREVHSQLSLRTAGLAIVNDGKPIVDCDRLSVVIRRGSQLEVLAVSGQEEIDPRAAAVRTLRELAAAVMPTESPLLYGGARRDLAPQLERPLQAHLDGADMRTLLVVPLARPAGKPGEPPPAAFAALVAECSDETRSADELLENMQPLIDPAARALANALEYEGLFLLPVWRALGRTRQLLQAKTLPKTLAAVAGIAAAVLALVLIPADFRLEGRGVLQPSQRREVFASLEGEVQAVHVAHGEHVEEGHPLATLRSIDLAVQWEKLEGQRGAAREHLSALEVALLGETALTRAEQVRLHGERAADQQTIASLDRELELLARKRAQLEVRSPIAGEVVTWNVVDTLIHRPVKRGDRLFTIVNPAGDWELEIRMPEARMGHVAQSRAASQEPLAVSFVAAHQPDLVLAGRLQDAEGRAEIRGDEGNTVLLKVAIDKSQLRDLRPGAEVTARVHCGRRCLGYVWFHDVISFIHARVLFRLW